MKVCICHIQLGLCFWTVGVVMVGRGTVSLAEGMPDMQFH